MANTINVPYTLEQDGVAKWRTRLTSHTLLNKMANTINVSYTPELDGIAKWRIRLTSHTLLNKMASQNGEYD